MAIAMSSQLKFAPLAVAVNVVVPPAELELTPTLASKESISVKAGAMRASSGSMHAILDWGARRVRALEDWVVFIVENADARNFLGGKQSCSRRICATVSKGNFRIFARVPKALAILSPAETGEIDNKPEQDADLRVAFC
jgi:hypothetical protein